MVTNKKSRKSFYVFLIVVAILALGAACRGEVAPEPTETPVAAPSPTPTVEPVPEADVPDRIHLLTVADVERFEPLVISHDGRYLAAGAYLGVHVWDLEEFVHLRAIEHPHQVSSIAFSPDGELILAGGVNGGLVVSRSMDGEQVNRNNYSMHIQAVAFFPDGNTIASGAWDKHVRLWQLDDFSEMENFEITDWVSSLAVSPDGSFIAAGDTGGIVRAWRLDNGNLLYELEAHNNYAEALAFSPDGEILASGGWGGWRLWRSADGSELHPGGLHTQDSTDVHALAFSPDGALVAVALLEEVVLWDMQELKPLHRLVTLASDGEPNWTKGVAFSPNGEFLAVAHWSEGAVAVWRLNP
jgi:COMPASS component SWD3